MLGIILCGGQSLRMGKDKGLLELQGKSWAKMASDKLALLNIPVKLSINLQQQAAYSETFSKDELIVDNDLLSLKGPLLGVLSCHLAFPHEDLFVLACDMPLMHMNFLQSLYILYQLQPTTAYLYTNGEGIEPLCGIYTSKGLSTVLAVYKNGDLIKHSMKFMLEHLDVKTLFLKEEEKKYFSNINTNTALNDL